MIQIELRPEVESALAAEAKSRGIELETYVAEIVESNAMDDSYDPTPSEREKYRRAVEDLIAFREERKLTLGGLKIKDMVHEGHKY
jgi:hypothetical protein